jgi:hypothetical protein
MLGASAYRQQRHQSVWVTFTYDPRYVGVYGTHNSAKEAEIAAPPGGTCRRLQDPHVGDDLESLIQ